MMSTIPPIFSQEDFLLFHRIDRDLYRILVFNLLREPTESIYILCLWLWLERVGFRNVIRNILTLPSVLINEVADESVTCLNCINPNNSQSASSSEPGDIPLLQNLVDGDGEISVQFFCKNKDTINRGVTKMVHDVGIRAFSDIMQNVMMLSNAAAAATAATMLESRRSSVMRPPSGSIWFGSIGPSNPMELDDGDIESRVLNLKLVQDVPADDRTMFVTFSRGYPVEEWEVREFFGRRFGDCIEDLYMQEVPANEQSLFARIVFRQLSIIEMILKGVEKAIFAINGKHVWARKFVPKQTAAGGRRQVGSNTTVGGGQTIPHLL